MPLEPFNLGLRMAGGFDSDALTAFAAVESAGGSLTGAQKAAANAFIIGLKTEGIWTNIKMMYLMLGGTSGAHAVNWRNPAAFSVTWVNSPTHDANGVTGSVTAYGDTGFNPNTQGMAQRPHGHFSYYRSVSNSGNRGLGGCADGTGAMYAYVSNITHKFSARYENNAFFQSVAAGNSGCSVYQRYFINPDAYHQIFRNGASDGGPFTNANSGAVPNYSVYLCAYNGAGTATYMTANQTLCAFGMFSDTWTATQQANFYTLMQALQTAFGRNV